MAFLSEARGPYKVKWRNGRTHFNRTARRLRSYLPDMDALTECELEVLSLIALGLSDKQIGHQTYREGKTASWHVQNIKRKLGASNRPNAVHIAHLKGIL